MRICGMLLSLPVQQLRLDISCLPSCSHNIPGLFALLGRLLHLCLSVYIE